MNIFQTNEYLKVFKKHFCDEKNVVLDRFETVDVKVIFLGMKPVLGNEEVSDYGDIVADDYKKAWVEIIEDLKSKGLKKLQLDYVREDSETYRFFKDKGKIEKQEVAPFIDLPETFEEYLLKLKRKHRKELKRKIKRLKEVGGEFERVENAKDEDFEEFIRLHRLSDGEKKQFMSEKMVAFFRDLTRIETENWKVVFEFLKIKNKLVAGVMVFESESEVWGYNSGFDPEYRYYSVGLVLKAHLIRKAIEAGKKRFDFLRGGERYKYELGGEDMQLYRIETD